MDREARDVLKDSFAHDMAEHQKLIGKEPTPAANERLAVPLFEMLEQKIADEAARQAAAPPTRVDPRPCLAGDALREECKKRGRERAADFMAIQRLPAAKASAPKVAAADLERARRIERRLHLLMRHPERGPLGQPSWRERVMAVTMLRFTIGVDRRRLAQELADLVEESVQPFGAWDVPAGEGRPLLFT